jgi:NitT/TauT family transport system substrate-binding protein
MILDTTQGSRLMLALGGALLVLGAGGAAAAELPVFSLAWSEYPSWSAFGVAHEAKLIDGGEGKTGPIEEKWGVDIVLKEGDYDTCLVMFGSTQCDAACITNMDALSPSLGRKAVGILPTSTSNGGDALIVAGDITEVKHLKGKKVYGLAKTVSEYCFVRNLEIQGEKEAEYGFTNMDPGAAALAMQQKKEGYDAIVVWNPFVLETLNKRKDSRVLFDSTTIPGEIIDMVVMAQSSLDREGGDRFAAAVADAFYQLNDRLNAADTKDDTLVALGEKFSHLDLQSMRKVVKQTLFYGTADKGVEVLTSQATKDIMKKVVEFCLGHEIVPKAPAVGYGSKAEAPDADFRLDPSFVTMVKEKK